MLVRSERALCAPKNLALLIDEQHGDLAVSRYLQAAAELVLIDVERNNPRPGFRICFVAAHGGVVPPAEDEVFARRGGQAIPAEVEVGVLEGLGYGHPCVDLRLLFGLEGDEEQVDVSGEISGQVEFGLVEAIGEDGWKYGRLCGHAVLRGVGKGQKQSAEREAA